MLSPRRPTHTHITRHTHIHARTYWQTQELWLQISSPIRPTQTHSNTHTHVHTQINIHLSFYYEFGRKYGPTTHTDKHNHTNTNTNTHTCIHTHTWASMTNLVAKRSALFKFIFPSSFKTCVHTPITHTLTHIHTQTHRHTDTHKNAHAHTQTDISVQLYIHTHTHAHACAHIQAHAPLTKHQIQTYNTHTKLVPKKYFKGIWWNYLYQWLMDSSYR